MDNNPKILSLDLAPVVLAPLRQRGKRLIQYHDSIDLFHPGLISLLEKAKSLGDLLVVTLTAPHHAFQSARPLSDRDRLLVGFLTGLPYVDYVVVALDATPERMIESVRPHVYCKMEFPANGAEKDGRQISNELAALKKVGATFEFIAIKPCSPSEALSELFQTHSPEVRSFCRGLAEGFPPDEFQRVADGFAELKVLIIGDIIFDRYCSVEVQGLTSKNRILSARLLSEDTQAGGALAVFRHVRQFTSKVKLISLLGTEPWANATLARFIEPSEHDVIQTPEFTTIIKQRFVEPRMEGKELSKLFSVNMIERDHPNERLQTAVLDRISGHIDQYDLVLVMDFGHGLLEEPVRRYVQEKSGFLALNCQTNSNNHGFNVINRQYSRADSFSLDQTEITLAVGRRKLDFPVELQRLAEGMGSKYAWLTRGGTETLGFAPSAELCRCAPFERNVVDTVGAGDAFCAVTSLAAARELPLPIATFMGQLAGAQAVRIVGNSAPVLKSKLIEDGRSMLSV